MKKPKLVPNNHSTHNETTPKYGLPCIPDNKDSIEFIESNAYPTQDTPIRIRVNTISNARRSMAAVIRACNAGTISENKARSMAYLFQTLAGHFKIESDLLEVKKLVEEMEELKEQINGHNRST